MATRIVSRVSGTFGEMVKRVTEGRFGRFIKFGVVGGSGVIVNLAIAQLFVSVLLTGVAGQQTRSMLAVGAGIVVSIFTNFVLNDAWTWADREKRGRKHWFQRLGMFYVISSIAAAVQLGVYTVTHHYILGHDAWW
ncbi:MAG: GtrA family protein, partial [Myxococcales bacterium]|nr:GtrA family protein [Myxococcales bacterium]